MVVGVVLADIAVESVGVDAARQQHAVQDRQVQHRLDDRDATRRQHGVVAADDLDLRGLAGLPVDCATP